LRTSLGEAKGNVPRSTFLLRSQRQHIRPAVGGYQKKGCCVSPDFQKGMGLRVKKREPSIRSPGQLGRSASFIKGRHLGKRGRKAGKDEKKTEDAAELLFLQGTSPPGGYVHQAT